MEEETSNIYICIIHHVKLYKVLVCTMECILKIHIYSSEEMELIYVGLLDSNTVNPVEYSRNIYLDISNISTRGWFSLDNYLTPINLLCMWGNIIQDFTSSSSFVIDKKRCIRLNYEKLIDSITRNIQGVEGAPPSNSMKKN